MKNNKTFIIAEIGNNHEGNFILAKKLIKLASECGADAVKFQYIIPEQLVSSNDQNRIQVLKKFLLKKQEYSNLALFAKRNNIQFFATPFDKHSFKFLNKIQNLFKISSGDNDHYHLIKLVANSLKPIILSTGMSNVNIIKKTVNLINEIWSKNSFNSKISLLHCISNYPTKDSDLNLNRIRTLIKEFPNCKIGFSDHSLGIDASLYAVSIGAKVIEKHFTLDNNYSDFRDHKIALNPENFKLMVKKIRKLEKIMGSSKIQISASEKNSFYNFKRSIVSNSDMKKNSKILEKNLVFLRPLSGIPASEYKIIINKKLNKNIKKGHYFQYSDIKE